MFGSWPGQRSGCANCRVATDRGAAAAGQPASLSGGARVGAVLAGHSIVLELALLVWLATAALFGRTRLGLAPFSVGENPGAGRCDGPVSGWPADPGCDARLGAVRTAGEPKLGGIAWLADGLTAGQGYIALVLVIFGRWRPSQVAVGALLLASSAACRSTCQGVRLPEVIEHSPLRGPGNLSADMLPYLRRWPCWRCRRSAGAYLARRAPGKTCRIGTPCRPSVAPISAAHDTSEERASKPAAGGARRNVG